MLNRYYHAAETTLASSPVVKSKFTADEMMAVFADRPMLSSWRAGCGTRSAVAPDRTQRRHCAPLRAAVGCWVAWASVLRCHRDTVNTAKRIESAAASGELLISSAVARPWGWLRLTRAPLVKARKRLSKFIRCWIRNQENLQCKMRKCYARALERRALRGRRGRCRWVQSSSRTASS